MSPDSYRSRSRPSIATDLSSVAAIGGYCDVSAASAVAVNAEMQPRRAAARRDTALPSPHSGQRVSRRHINAVPLRAAQLNRATIHNAAHALYVHGTDDRLNLCRVP